MASLAAAGDLHEEVLSQCLVRKSDIRVLKNCGMGPQAGNKGLSVVTEASDLEQVRRLAASVGNLEVRVCLGSGSHRSICSALVSLANL